MLHILGLHGSSGHPESIEKFVEKLAPAVPRYCPTGTFPDGEGFTFFRRNPDFSIPPSELMELASQHDALKQLRSKFPNSSIISVGFSSGAIFATALLAVSPKSFAGAILLRPQVITDDFVFPDLSGKPVLIISGLHDSRRQPHHSSKLARQLSEANATVTHQALEAGHGLASDDSDLTTSRSWMAETFGPMR